MGKDGILCNFNQELHQPNLKADYALDYATRKPEWSNTKLAYILLLTERRSVDSCHCEHVQTLERRLFFEDRSHK